MTPVGFTEGAIKESFGVSDYSLYEFPMKWGAVVGATNRVSQPSTSFFYDQSHFTMDNMRMVWNLDNGYDYCFTMFYNTDHNGQVAS